MGILSLVFSEPLALGVEAPDFTLADQDGNAVSLKGLRGSKNVVLVFYPGDETMICRKQLCEFRDHWPDMQSKDTTILGINPQSAESHDNFKTRQSFQFPLLVDTGKSVAKLYNASGLIIKRTVYLIGKSGRIRFAQRGKPAPEEVLKTAE